MVAGPDYPSFGRFVVIGLSVATTLCALPGSNAAAGEKKFSASANILSSASVRFDVETGRLGVEAPDAGRYVVRHEDPSTVAVRNSSLSAQDAAAGRARIEVLFE